MADPKRLALVEMLLCPRHERFLLPGERVGLERCQEQPGGPAPGHGRRDRARGADGGFGHSRFQASHRHGSPLLLFMTEQHSSKLNKFQGLPWNVPGFDVWLTIARTYQLCERAITQRVAPLGISLAQHDVLANVVHSPGLTQQEIADRLLVARSNVSMLLSSMEKSGLLERTKDENDRRIRRIFLTPHGRKIVEASLAAQTEVVDKMISAIEQSEIMAVGVAMEKVEQALQPLLRDRAPRDTAS
ncbi:MAG: MarR family winged helix-turn-helix transcriptional regulator [Rhodospirillales bacterium]|nr:MarR family winged helix-turn-helix transcriptional regulator [Rhodospirillales bacterium]